MSWLEDIQNNRKRQVEQMAKAFGYDNSTIQKAEDTDVSEEEETTSKSKDGDAYAGKSDMYKMRMLGLRKFTEQDQKEYIGVEDTDNSYIANLENGDIVISKTDNGYLVSKFPIDENNEGDEQEATDLSEAIKIALRFKEELENDEDEPEQIMYKEETDKAFDDEINPFEREAWETSLSKAELDEFEKAKHADGDMHPNGKWVWRSSANGGKGDWRVASPSKRVTGCQATAYTPKKEEKKINNKFSGKEQELDLYNDKGDKMSIRVYKDGWVKVENVNTHKDFKNADNAWEWLKKEGYTKSKEENDKRIKGYTHDINGTKVTVSKNRDGSYILEANGKKVKSDDPSFFRDTLKPSVKKALAKEVGI
jgi:hypothetical protein